MSTTGLATVCLTLVDPETSALEVTDNSSGMSRVCAQINGTGSVVSSTTGSSKTTTTSSTTTTSAEN